VLAAVVLAGHGFDVMQLRSRWATTFPVIIGVLAIACWGVGTWIESSGQTPDGIWGGLLSSTATTGRRIEEIYEWPMSAYGDPKFIGATAAHAGNATRQTAYVLAIAATLLAVSRYKPDARYGVLLLVIVEMWMFAGDNWSTCTATPTRTPAAWEPALAQLPADQRVLITYMGAGDFTTFRGQDAAWGYDSCGTLRWAQMMFASQGYSPDQASQYFDVRQPNLPVFQLTRCGLMLTTEPNALVIPVPRPMAVAQLVGTARVISQRDEVLKVITDPSFNPRREVVLDSSPAVPLSGQSDCGTATAQRVNTDEWRIHADVKSAAILLVTEPYSRGWRAESATPSGPRTYDITPADWAMQGIALSAGSHDIRLYFEPTGFRVGRWVTLASLIGYAAVSGLIFCRERRSDAPN